ncbi:class I SAM-dependent methyltransferase [Prauserella endophytica]|uniref:Class I SAM-dependent methyltransferase n=1 Tax=Prauserella endophytica TaxID=1592324 RepID=A0ABY2S8D2_9PSEU|nr:class I SAM-dependent methyltransferase [Prauserella endophytica]PXY30348.1 hypothetical protein BAY59_14200 [Prauserella coralliicola]TKG72158.1 class I SAM-dependent methyltransferase [Prauserella endophytica]
MTTSFQPASLLAALLAPLRGTVLELGPGTGVNLPHYAPGVTWIGVEPDPRSRGRLGRAIARLGGTGEVLDGRAERLDLPGHSVDAVVATFVLCSVDDVTAALTEIRRVLRPGGRYVLAEHVAAPQGTWVRRGQDGLARASRWFGGKCRPNRCAGSAIARAGFELADVHRFVVPGPLGAGIPHLAGAAVRPADTGKGPTS